MPKVLLDHGAKILIVEDDVNLRRIYELKCFVSGVNVDFAKNGDEALGKMRGRKLIVLDIGLPGMDGMAVLEEMKKRGIDVPVIVISNYDETERQERCINLGAKLCLVKAHLSMERFIELIKPYDK